MDARLREAERGGDAERLRAERLRAGHCPAHGLKLGKRGTCRTCRQERSRALAREREAKRLAQIVWAQRRARESHPEGEFDGGGRWYPSEREDGDGDVTGEVRSPSRAWPWSYMHRARTRAHCRHLVRRALDGLPVPRDVARVVVVGRTREVES